MDNSSQNSNSKVMDAAKTINNLRDTAAKVRTAGAVASTVGGFLIANAPLIILILLVLGGLYAVINIIQRPGADSFDFAAQCLVFGQPTDQNCTNFLLEKTGDQLAPEEESKGGIANPNDTYTN